MSRAQREEWPTTLDEIQLWIVKRAVARILGTHRNRNYCFLRPKENGG